MTRRNMVVVGDPLSTGGAVLPHNHNMNTRKGVPFAYINGKVHCDACNSTGVIAKAGGPKRLDFHGQDVALEGDIVMCKCPVPPTLVARAVATSKPGAWADDFDETLGVLPAPNKAEVLRSAGIDPTDYGFEANRRFRITDEATGYPLIGVAYVLECDGQILKGVTDSEGMTNSIYSVRSEALVSVHIEVKA